MDVPLEGRGATATPGPGRVQNMTGRGDGVRLFLWDAGLKL